MPHRSHLFSLRVAHALRERLEEPYRVRDLRQDLLAGITVGIIAIPLAMALGIASGVPPQYGLYTAIIAGFLIALTGGSRLSVSGPTAAFVVILHPIAMQYGLAGLLVASVLAGLILVALALLRLGRLIEYIPEAVTLGFTGGIAIVIATLQLKDFLGLQGEELPEHYVEKVAALASALPGLDLPSLIVAGITLFSMILWPRLKTPLPPHLVAVIIGTLVALLLNGMGLDVDTIGSRFHYLLDDGRSGAGIPPVLPRFTWPWLQPGPAGAALQWNWQTVHDLLMASFAIAMLGAIESLLCAVVLDGMTGKRHSANSELLGQGIGNLVAPFFGGITATAALARSAANFRAGAQSPIAAMIHALVVLLGLAVLAPVLSYLPMPAMAALLVMVAWNMSEAPKAVHLLKTAPRRDVLVFLACLSLTVLFDMVVAITAGIILAALLFMQEIAALTRVTDITGQCPGLAEQPGKGSGDGEWRVFKISGPLFFAAADRVFGELSTLCNRQRGIILHLEGVAMLDAGGLVALSKLIAKCRATNTCLYVTELQFQPLKTLARAGVEPIPGVSRFFARLDEAVALAVAGCGCEHLPPTPEAPHASA